MQGDLASSPPPLASARRPRMTSARHDTPRTACQLASSMRRPSEDASRLRARASRDMTVPIGTPVIWLISRYDSSCSSRNTMTSRNSGGRLATARSITALSDERMAPASVSVPRSCDDVSASAYETERPSVRERQWREGLLKERRTFDHDAVSHDCVVRVAGHVEDTQSRASRRQSLEQWRPVRLGHDDVAHEQMDRALISVGPLRGLARIARLDHVISVMLERHARQPSHGIVVLHEQQRLRALLASRLARRCDGRCVRPRHARKVYLEGRTLSGLAVDHDVSAALLDDAVHRREPQSGSAASALGREEGFEDPLTRRLVDTHAGIRNAQLDVLPWRDWQMPLPIVFVQRDVPCLDRQPATARHGIGGVDHQVDQNLLELRRIDQNESDRGREVQADVDPFDDQSPQHQLHAAYERIDVHHLRLHDLLSAERQKLPGESGRALARPSDLDQIHSRGIILGHFSQPDFTETEHRREHIVEVMRNPAGKQAEGLHFLRLTKLVFRVTDLGNVFRQPATRYACPR